MLVCIKNLKSIENIKGLSGPFAIAISHDDSKICVTNFGSNNFAPFGTTLGIYNTMNGKLINNVQLGIQPSGLALTRDGKYAIVSNYNTLYSDPINFTGLTAGQGTISVVNIENGHVKGTPILVGQSPANVILSKDSSKAFISNYTSNTVSIVNLKK